MKSIFIVCILAFAYALFRSIRLKLRAASVKKNGECKRSKSGHDWKRRYLAGGFWHHGSLGRDGEMCCHCAKVRYPETDEEYFNKLPQWLKNNPDLRTPTHFVSPQNQPDSTV